MTAPAQRFFRLTLVYFLCMLPVVWLLRADPLGFLINTAKTPLAYVFLLVGLLPWLVGLLVLLLIFNRRRFNRDMLTASAYAFGGSLLFAFTFGALKPTMPLAFGFWADPLFARIDRILHFGVDPWRLAHKLAAYIPPDLPQVFYFSIWLMVAIIFPLFLVLVDRDPRRVARFLLLYALIWIVLGNILALAGLSAGPVFYDRLLGGNRFSDLTEVLVASGIAGTAVGFTQTNLWHYLVDLNQTKGSGISAFPSVHVGIAALLALYGFERGAVWGMLGAGFCAIILFLSVYLGWHYALDGYFSILAVWLVWRRKWAL